MFNKKGYTLIELLIYIAIFATVAGVLSGILATFVRIQSQQTASASVSQELAFVQTTIQRLVRESVNIENKAGADYASSTLILRMASSTLDPTIISSDANAIYLKQGTGDTQSLTSNQVRVSQFQAVKYENPGGHAIAQIDLSLTYNSPRVYQQITQNFKLSIGRVTAATFDDNLMPNIDNTYSIGVSPYSWKNAAFSGNLTIGGNVGIGTTGPIAKLHVEGTQGRIYLKSTATDSNTGIQLANDASQWELWTRGDDSDKFKISDTTTARLVIDTNGNVGIGTTAPNAKLSIVSSGTETTGTSQSNAFRVSAGAIGDTAGSEVSLGSFSFKGSATNNMGLGIRGYRVDNGTAYISTAVILGFDVDNSVREGGYITLKQGGNVGIGTTEPNSTKGSGGYLDTKDVYLRDSGKWASEAGGDGPIIGYNHLTTTTYTSSPTYIDTITVTVNLPAGRTYTVVAWGSTGYNGYDNSVYRTKLVIDGTDICEGTDQTNDYGGLSLVGRKIGVASGNRIIKIQQKTIAITSYIDESSLLVMAYPE